MFFFLAIVYEKLLIISINWRAVVIFAKREQGSFMYLFNSSFSADINGLKLLFSSPELSHAPKQQVVNLVLNIFRI